MSAPDFARPPTVIDAVLSHIREDIVSGKYTPGRPITIDSVARELGVSRIPVREALKALEGEGHVYSISHRGYFLKPLDINQLREIYTMRGLIEPELARMALPKVTDAQVAKMEELVARMQEPGSSFAELNATNREFHMEFYNASGATRMMDVLRTLWDWVEPYRAVYFTNRDASHIAHDEHEQIVEAIKTKEIDKVVEAIMAHHASSLTVLDQMLSDS